MDPHYIIGIDIGGTNTDGVLLDSTHKILASCKTTTTHPVYEGFSTVISQLAPPHLIDRKRVLRIAVGTTQAINALLTQQDLYRVGLIRIVQRPPLIPAAFDWPSEIRNAILGKAVEVPGGVECDGRVSANLSASRIRDALDVLLKSKVESVALVGSFSPLYSRQESYAFDICREACELPITASHQVGGVGVLERENATLLNAALRKSMRNGFCHLERIVRLQGITCPIYLTQNNGTLISLVEALQFPIKTVLSGPSNSCVGAAQLTGLSNAVVVDMGGTTTDVGIVVDSFVRRASADRDIGGIKLNFSMPDVISIPIGGGSIIGTEAGRVTVRPKSLGARTLSDSQSFGGNVPTVTDVAIRLGLVDIEDANASQIELSTAQCEAARATIQNRVDGLVELIRGPKKDLPTVVVGGGAALGLLDGPQAHVHAGVANAFGAALAEISSTKDVVVCLSDRQRTISGIEHEVIEATIKKGAIGSSVRIVYRDIRPYHYVPGDKARVIITAAGRLE